MSKILEGGCDEADEGGIGREVAEAARTRGAAQSLFVRSSGGEFGGDANGELNWCSVALGGGTGRAAGASSSENTRGEEGGEDRGELAFDSASASG